jgi:hypothetical protein
MNLLFYELGMSSIVSASPFAAMNPFALPTCNGQSYGSSIVTSTKWSNRDQVLL